MISNLGYLVLEVSNLDAWKKFAIDTIGFDVSKTTNDSLNLRLDHYKSRIFIESGSADDMVAAGWEFTSEASLNSYVSNLIKKSGLQVVEADENFKANRSVEKLFLHTDTGGMRHEFYYRASHAEQGDTFDTSKITHGFRTADELGIGHFVVADDLDGTLTDFYLNTLGLQLSDTCYGPVKPGVNMVVSFLRTHTGRHHSIATAKLPFKSEKKIHHIMFEVNKLVDVGKAFDRCKEAGLVFEMELGGHPNDQVFSFYVKTPSGFALEIGYGAITVNDAEWDIKHYTQLSSWGHENPAHKIA